MHSFKDPKGQTWDIFINVNTIKRVRSRCNVNLLDVFEGKLLDRLATDPVLLVDVLYVLCQPQADMRNITDEMFAELMAGDVIEAATKALCDELVSFSPSPKHRDTLQRVLRAMWNSLDRARDLAAARVNEKELEHELERIITKALDDVSPPSARGLSGGVPA